MIPTNKIEGLLILENIFFDSRKMDYKNQNYHIDEIRNCKLPVNINDYQTTKRLNNSNPYGIYLHKQ